MSDFVPPQIELISKAAINAAERLELPMSIVKTIAYDPVRSLLLVRLYRLLDMMVGGNNYEAKNWILSKNKSFEGNSPLEVLISPDGLRDIVKYLEENQVI